MNRRHLAALAVFFVLLVTIRLGMRYRTAPGASQELAMRAEAEGVAAERDTSVNVDGAPPEAAELLRSGRSWRAARAMRDLVARPERAEPPLVLAAARAEAGWGGWSRVRELLGGREWLGQVGDGEGWFLLARAHEENGAWTEAVQAYRQHLRNPNAAAERRAVAELRLGLALLRSGQVAEGTAALARARANDSDVRGWAGVLAAEALAAARDTAGVRRLLGDETAVAVAPARLRRAYLQALTAAGDPRTARARALEFRDRASGDAERAGFGLHAARAALALGDTAAAREELRAAFTAAPGSAAGRGAADLFVSTGAVPAADRLALGRVRERQGAPEQAAANYRAWLASGRGTTEERQRAQLRLAQFLFNAGRYRDARREARSLANAPAGVAAPALYLAGRAEFRGGSRGTAQATWRQLAERFPREAAAADALFMIADLAHDEGGLRQAREFYTRTLQAFPGTERGSLAAMRLGGMAWVAGDHREAARVWDGYRAAQPGGDAWLQATYWAGRAHLALGDSAGARARFREVRAREPVSYYSVRSAERLGEAFWPISLDPPPPDDAAARRRVEGWMSAVDVLRDAGLHEEAEAEAERLVERAGEKTPLLYPLAEALNDRGYTIRGVNIGYRLQRGVERPNPRLLRILYPFPYRRMIAAEAREKGLDPFLVAALTRQESVFKARISSPVGARGLMQVMPETGRALARGAEIRQWDADLLFNPEINVYLGTRYLAEQMREYDRSLPYVFSAYNAGPRRVTQWRRFPERRDPELFTERIPFAETRGYVKILTRNIALYEGLYGE